MIIVKGKGLSNQIVTLTAGEYKMSLLKETLMLNS